MQKFTHILQKTGVLKTFTVAKIMKKKDVDDLKNLVRSMSADESEYKTMLAEELAKMSNMHDKKNPIPGIIYGSEEESKSEMIKIITMKFSKGLKAQNFDKQDLAFLVTAIINELGLTQEDFQKLKKDLDNEDYDDEEEDEEDEENDRGF